jgi:hypothetical protein
MEPIGTFPGMEDRYSNRASHNTFVITHGVTQSNLTGMCWDGVNVYGVSTSISSSQIFTINWTTGSYADWLPQSNCAGAIFLLGRLGSQNWIYSADIVSDNFLLVE